MKATASPQDRGRAIHGDRRENESCVLSPGCPAYEITLLGEQSRGGVWIFSFSPSEDFRDAFQGIPTEGTFTIHQELPNT